METVKSADRSRRGAAASISAQGRTGARRRLNPQSTTLLCVLHLVAALGLWRVVQSPPSAKVWVLFVALWIVPQLGVTVGYHRMETHHGFKCPPWVRAVLFVLGGMAVQGDVIGWVLNHRVHHRYEDQPGLDLHSPLEYPGMKGLLWAHVGWLLFHYERPAQFRSSPRLEADSLARWQRRWYVLVAATGFIIPLALAGWDGLLVAGFIRVVMGLHITWSVNSVCHRWGRRARDSIGNTYLGDDSRNNRLVQVLGLGEGYHSNHHAQPSAAFHGWRWFSFDPSKWVIQALEGLRLAWGVRRPNPDFVLRPDQLTAVEKASALRRPAQAKGASAACPVEPQPPFHDVGCHLGEGSLLGEGAGPEQRERLGEGHLQLG